MPRLRVKIHDVLHDRYEGHRSISEIEERIERHVEPRDAEVSDIRIASGDKNSPIFFTVEANSVSADDLETIAGRIVREFGRYVDDVDRDAASRGSNVQVRETLDETEA